MSDTLAPALHSPPQAHGFCSEVPAWPGPPQPTLHKLTRDVAGVAGEGLVGGVGCLEPLGVLNLRWCKCGVWCVSCNQLVACLGGEHVSAKGGRTDRWSSRHAFCSRRRAREQPECGLPTAWQQRHALRDAAPSSSAISMSFPGGPCRRRPHKPASPAPPLALTVWGSFCLASFVRTAHMP